MLIAKPKIIKLATAPVENDIPVAGSVYQWFTLDGSNNLVINYKLSDGTIKTFSATTNTFSAMTLVYGTNSNGCVWTDNILSINHALNTSTPDIKVWVLNDVSGKYEEAEIPHSVTDANNVLMDFTGCTGLTFNITIK